jgi:hypothetical protein
MGIELSKGNSRHILDAPLLDLVFYAGIVVLSSTIICTAEADTFRCGSKVVSTGDSSSAVIQNCGKPLNKDKGYEVVRLKEGRKKVRVERWRYKKSSRSLERIVMIYRGRVVAIDTGQR